MQENKINYVEIFNEIFENFERTNSACVYAFKVEGIYLYIGTTNAFFERLKRHFKANTKIGYFLRIAYQEKLNKLDQNTIITVFYEVFYLHKSVVNY